VYNCHISEMALQQKLVIFFFFLQVPILELIFTVTLSSCMTVIDESTI
jgi:hypothetical protein